MPAILSETAHHQKCNVSKSGLIVACFSHFDFDSVSRHSGVHFFDASTSKSDPKPSVLTLLISKRVSRHNGVHFLNISTSKSDTSAPNMVRFANFDFKTRV